MTPARGLCAMLALGAMALAGCGSGSGADGSAAPSSSASAPAASSRQLVLAAADLPSGMSMADFAMDDDVVRAVLEPLTGQRPTGTTYSPSACAPVSMFDGATQPAASLAGVAAGEGGGRSTFTEAVVARRPDIAAVAAYVRRCPIVVQNDGGTPLTTTFAVRDGDRGRADQLLVVEETPDDPLSKQRALVAYARVGDYAVWARLRAFQGESVDRAQFDRLVAAAVDKVARSA
ncbi:hypothetical protein LB823_04550 [Tsukamurella sp. M9C]|uniref:hypothetical protein n=1 Tax=Tsukamurella sp. M9C TaxID=2877520 RepID=UPI001CC9B53E|nr:hypothetical protein [Tsukamurella sp. M9C]MCA0155462.1 hypothetical protein [Tsukamurella sp. M9C]